MGRGEVRAGNQPVDIHQQHGALLALSIKPLCPVELKACTELLFIHLAFPSVAAYSNHYRGLLLREGGREGGRERERESGSERERGREGESGSEREREREREGGRVGVREGRERGREGEREREEGEWE